ncbi:MAG: GIY-YIG nuclease family protein [Proteocatella sp.]
MKAFGKTISLFLIEGDPNKRWVCELSNWNGKAYKFPRTEVTRCSDRADLAGCGIYFLFGRNDESEKESVYIGEAENVFVRLKQHLAGKDFWNECITFVSKDNRLNKAHIKYLEHECYWLAKNANRYIVENPSIPAKASLTEAEEAELAEFLHNVKIIMNTLGHKVLESIIDYEKQVDDKNISETLYIKAARGAEGQGKRTTDGFVVLKGSRIADPVTTSYGENLNKLRKKLLDSKVINEEFYFTEDKIFGSPSTAAAIVMGRSANGLKEWKTMNGGTLADIDTDTL